MDAHEASGINRTVIASGLIRLTGSLAERRAVRTTSRWAAAQADLAILDEIDSGLDVDALRDVATAVNGLRTENNAVLMITHYQVRAHVREAVGPLPCEPHCAPGIPSAPPAPYYCPHCHCKGQGVV